MSGYHAELEDDDHLIDNPARKAARALITKTENALASAERGLAALRAGPATAAAQANYRGV